LSPLAGLWSDDDFCIRGDFGELCGGVGRGDECVFRFDASDFDGGGGGGGKVDCYGVGEGEGADLGEEVEFEVGGVELDYFIIWKLAIARMVGKHGETYFPSPRGLEAQYGRCGRWEGRCVLRCGSG